MRALLRQELDWGFLVQTAQRHTILPTLYESVVRTYPEMLPEPELEGLRRHYQRNVRRDFALTGELLKTLNLLAAHGIAAVPFRGPVLAASVYGDYALRQFGDLDLLLHKGDVLRARELLVAQGYSVPLQLNPAQEAAYLRAQAEHKVFTDDGDLIIELHWQITESYFSFPLDPEDLWQRLVPVRLDGQEVRTFSPEDLLLILCAHGTKHVWERLAWICDIGKLICACASMDWERVVGQARMLRSERMLFLGLSLANRLLGAPLPDQVLQQVRADPMVEPLAHQACEWLFRDDAERPQELEAIVYHLKARERMQDRVRYCLRLAVTTTPGDWGAVRLPSALFPMYYLLRPFRLLAEYGPGLARRLLPRA
jgi:hypothetical protein